MKLTTEIIPRRDGTVTATVPATDSVPSGRYTFKQDADGRLVCDVEHESHIGFLLDTGFFYPADEADIEAGIDAVNQQQDEGEEGGEEEDVFEVAEIVDPAADVIAEHVSASVAEEQPKSKKKNK